MTADTRLSRDTTLATLVAEHPARARLFEMLHLDYCCGGGQTLAEACAKRGLDLDTVQAALRRLEDAGADDDVENTDWRDVGVVALCEGSYVNPSLRDGGARLPIAVKGCRCAAR